MDLHRLRGFFTVVRYGGFTAAAKRLRLSQPSVSLQVKALESELGVQLLERTSKRVILTRDGQVLYELSQRLFETEEEIRAVFEGRSDYESARLTVSTNQSIASPILASYSASSKKRKKFLSVSGLKRLLSSLLSTVRFLMR